MAVRSSSRVMRPGLAGLFVLAGALTLVAAIFPAAPAAAARSWLAGPAAARPVRVSAAPGGLAAMRDARRQHSRVEITADRTAFSQTFANPNGTTTYVASAKPRWVARGKSWVRADADLVRNRAGDWSPAAAESGLQLSGGGTRVLATVRSGRHSMSVSWPARLPVPHISGATATYPGVFPGVDLVLTAQVSGAFAETLVVRSAAAARDPQLSNIALTLSLSKGLVQYVRRDGTVVVRDAAGKAIFSSPPAVAWDSAGAAGAGSGSSVAGPGRSAHLVAVPTSYGPDSVRMRVPAGLLSGARTVFPVYVDPSYTVTQAWQGYGEIQSAYPTAAELDSTFNGQVSVGFDGSGIDRGMYVFGLPSAADGATTDVLSATLTDEALTTYTSSSVSHTVNAYYVSQYTSTSTWDSPPSQLAGPTAATFTTTSTTPDQNVTWKVASWLQTDLDADGWQFSAELVNSSESSTTPFVEFSPDPTLSITYDHAPLQPSFPTMTPQNWAENGSLYTSSLTPSFSATATDPDGDPVAYQFQILSGSTVVESGTTSAVTSGTAGSWTATSALANDTAYTVQVRGYDGTEYGSWMTASFTTDSGAPAAPTLTCTGYPSGSWSALISGGTTCTLSDSSPLIEGYAYGIQDGSGTATWTWTTNPTITIDPTSDGEYTISYQVTDDANVTTSAAASYTFGVGVDGAMLTPADGSQTATSVSLQAAAPAGYTSATFEYREGSTGSFQDIPDHVVYDCGCPVTWPVSTSTDSTGVTTDSLTWYVTRTLADDGPVQIEAVFTNSSGGTDTTPPVTVTLNRIGTGADYGTTQIGPVTVGLQSGNAAVTATDVNVASYGASLTVTRAFNSVEPSVPSIFGWGWTSSITGGVTSAWTQLTDYGSYVVLASADGSNDTFAAGSTNDGVTAFTPEGDAVTSGLTLTENTGSGTFTLTNSTGTVTAFQAANPATSTYQPVTVTVPGDSSSAGFIYDTTSGDATYGDPLLMVAPDAASSAAATTACPYPASASTWTAGCRGLAFSYNSAGDVSQITFDYVDNSGTFHSAAVAGYTYDAAGELISESDPRLATPLATTYTYDETPSDADYGRITQISPAQQAGSGALAPWTFTYDDTSGDVNYGKVLTISRMHSSAYGGATATSTIDYSVPLTTAAGGPVDMDAATVAGWGQSDVPASAVAVFPPSHVPSSPPTASDYQYAEIDYYDASGREVNTASYINGAWAVTTTQYDSYGNVISSLSAADRATALAASDPAATASSLSTVNIYGCDNFGTVGPCTSSDQQYQVLTDTYGPAHDAYAAGVIQAIREHTAYSYDAGAPNSDTNAAGNPYMLVTTKTDSASLGDTIPGTGTADTRTTGYTYANSSTTIGWTLGTPLTTITDPSGLDIVSTSVFNTSSSLYQGDNLQTDTYMPESTGGGGAGDTQTIYYTAGSNPLASGCGNKPEWANLTCQTGPASQPGTSGLPPLPVTSYTYDDYLNVATKTEAFGSPGTRVTTYGYDTAERPSTQAITTTGTGMGTAIPETRTVYSASTGLPTDTETLNSAGTVTADISTTYDDFGNPLTYTDASGNTTTNSYDIASRVTSVNDGEGTTTYGYSPGGQVTSESDSQAGTFSATYTPDGTIATQTYPGGVTATYGYDSTGNATSVSYDGPDWTSPLSDTVVPNAQGDWASQSTTDTSQSLVSVQDYSYDSADRLSSVQDTEAGQCVTRSYTYNADSDRTSLATAAPGAEGVCQTASPATEDYSYDPADRITSTGYTYDTQGDITTTPSADAGGSGDLTASYYANDMLASQNQDGQSITWGLDPTQSRYSSYAQGGTTYTNHYSSSASTPSWVSGSDGSWTRDVRGPNGLLAAQVTPSGVTLMLTNLHGDIMADASTSDTATGPTTTCIYNEFGLPETGTIGAYGWLGGYLISGDALGGDLLMGARAYSTADGRFDQVDPVPGGSANPYDYAGQNPLTNYDLAGLWGVRCYDYTCGYEFDNWRTNDIAYAAWIAWVASSSIAAAYVCKVLSTFGAGAICAAVIGVFVAVFSGGFHWVARCLYVGYGWGGWKHVLLWNGCN